MAFRGSLSLTGVGHCLLSYSRCSTCALVIMITYLHHTDPVVPHYRGTEWTFQRGAAATVDRPILGWQGRFFLHDVAHYHVIHHVSPSWFSSVIYATYLIRQFFPKMPFYHAPEATKYLKAFLGEYYMYDDTPAFKALWRNYNFCQFVEDDGWSSATID